MSYLDYDEEESVRALLKRCGFHARLRVDMDHNLEIEKQRALQELQQQHDEEMENLFSYLEVELSKMRKANNDKIAFLQEELEETNYKIATLQDKLDESRHEVADLQDKLDESTNEIALLQNRLEKSRCGNEILRKRLEKSHAGSQRVSALENEVAMLKKRLKDQENEMVCKQRQYFSEIDSKNKEISSLRSDLISVNMKSDRIVLNTKVEARKKNRSAITYQEEEIRKLKSGSRSRAKKLYSQDAVKTINVESNTNNWEVHSELTNENDFDDQKRKKSQKSDVFAVKSPLTTRSNKQLRSSMYLIGEEQTSPQIEIWREKLKKDADNSLSKRLERMYCAK